MSNALTRAVNGEVGTATARIMMYLSIPALGLMSFLIHEWVVQPVVALTARVTTIEQTLPPIIKSQHDDELAIGIVQNSLELGRADQLQSSASTNASIVALSTKTDQLQSTVSTVSTTLAGVAATLDILKDHTVATRQP